MMTRIAPRILEDKKCFVYCGPEHCNCKAGNPTEIDHMTHDPAEALREIVEMIDNCADVPRNPDSLIMMVLAHAKAALASPAPAGGDQGGDVNNLITVIADIREKSGVGSKPMLSELADAIAARIASEAVAEWNTRAALGGEGLLSEARSRGWMVAVHNDYRLNGEFHTFWLFTTPDGRAIKGEGKTDAEAIAAALAITLPPASPDVAGVVERLRAFADDYVETSNIAKLVNEAATLLEAKSAEVEKLREALRDLDTLLDFSEPVHNEIAIERSAELEDAFATAHAALTPKEKA